MNRRWLSYISAVFLCLFTLSLSLIQILFLWQVRPLLERQRLDERRYLQAYLDDLKFLAGTPYLHPARSGQADAGVFLNAKVYWTPHTPQLVGAESTLVPDATRESVMRLKDDWLRKFARAPHFKVDTSLLNSLDRFDHWDLERNSPIGDLMVRRQYVHPSRLPTPDVQDLQVFVKIRLMLAAAGEFDILSTLKAVRTFALLMLTTENQQLMLGGLTILEDENFAYQFFVNELKFDSTRWEPIDLQIIRRAHRAILATSSYMHLWTHPDLLEKIYLGENPPVGFCAAANESLPIEFSMRGALEPQLPLEMNFQREYNTLDTIYRKAHETCRVRYLMEMSAFDAFRSDAHGPLVLEVLPYWRKLFGLRKSLLHFRGFPDYSQK